MEAEFTDDEDAYLPRELIESCATEGIETFTREQVVDGRLARTGKFFAGTDLGLKIDRSAVAVVEKHPSDINMVHVTAFPQGTIFSTVTGYLSILNQRLQTLSRIYIDETGLGGFFVPDAIKAGLKNAIGVNLSMLEKQKIMDVLKRSMQNGLLHMPHDPELLNEMSNERVQLSKTGQLQFSHPAGTHDDRFWAVALAVYAARNEIPEYHPVGALGRNPNYIGPTFDWRRSRRGVGYFNTSRPWDPPWANANNHGACNDKN